MTALLKDIAQLKTAEEKRPKELVDREEWEASIGNLQFETGELGGQVKGLDENITKVSKTVHNELMRLHEMLEGKGLKKAF